MNRGGKNEKKGFIGIFVLLMCLLICGKQIYGKTSAVFALFYFVFFSFCVDWFCFRHSQPVLL